MHRNQSVSAHSFAMVPRADIPRSRFNVQTSHKTTFDAGKLIPIYVDEVLPGDTFSPRRNNFVVYINSSTSVGISAVGRSQALVSI